MSELRKRIGISALRLSVYSYYGLNFLAKKLFHKGDSPVQNILYYPAVKDLQTLSDVVNRASWYLPQSLHAQPRVEIGVPDNLVDTDLGSLPAPITQKRYINTNGSIRLIRESEIDLSKADAILLWDKAQRYSLPVIRNIDRVYVVDPTYYFSVEAETYQRMYYRTLSPSCLEYYDKLFKENYRNLLNEAGDYDKGYVFGSGPTLEQHALDFSYDDGFRVICNSIVKNTKLMQHINPHVLVFGDAQHHASPCKYAATFRQTVLDKQKEFGFYILTKDYFAPLLLAHYPGLKDKIIGIEAPGVWDLSLREILRMILLRPHKIPWFDKIPGHEEAFNFPTIDKFYVRSAGSVLPSYMIPLASAVCKDVYVIGADGRDPNGRKPDETYIWSYSSSCQFDNDLMKTAFETHPAYFRDRPFTEVMDIYCDNYEELIEYGEHAGKKYHSLPPSFIPVLAQRFARREKPN